MIRKFSPLVLAVISSLFFVGCMNYYPAQEVYPEFREKIIFPTFPHSDTVNIYMPGDTLPEKLFIEVGVFEFQVNRRTTTEQLKGMLIGLAMDEGLDAVYLADVFEEEPIPFEFNTPGKWVSAIGLVYPEYVDYLEYFAKEQRLFYINAEGKKDTLLQRALIDFEGDIQLIADSQRRVNAAYMEYVYNYSLPHLIDEKTPNWRFKNEKGMLKRRSLYNNAGQEIKRVILDYENENNVPNNRITKITITLTDPNSKAQVTDIITFELKEEEIKAREIKRNGEDFLKESYIYDDMGRLKEVRIFQKGDVDFDHVLTLEYVYYTNIEAYQFVPKEIQEKYPDQMPAQYRAR